MDVNAFVWHWWGMAREDPHFRLRLPEYLKELVAKSAEEGERSMTAEIVRRLHTSFEENTVSVKLPDGLMGLLLRGSEESGRTLQAEIIHRLEAYEVEHAPPKRKPRPANILTEAEKEELWQWLQEKAKADLKAGKK